MAISITDASVMAALGPEAFSTGSLLSDAQSIVFYFLGGGLIALGGLLSLIGRVSRARRVAKAEVQENWGGAS